MSKEIIIALIVAGSTLITSIITLFVGLKNLRITKERLDAEKEHLNAQIERFNSERAKFIAETDKLRLEIEDNQTSRREKTQATLEVEKNRIQSILEKRDNVYAEILTLVYRLKNQFRESIYDIDGIILESGWLPKRKLFYSNDLYLLTENLYRYRAFIDEDTFDLLHHYKRLLQDAKIKFDYCDRPPGNSMNEIKDSFDYNVTYLPHIRRKFTEHRKELREIFTEIDDLHKKITIAIKTHVEEILRSK